MGGCCCRHKISVETQTIFVGRAPDCTHHMDALTEDRCHDIDDYRIPTTNRNPKTLHIDKNCIIVNPSSSTGPINSDILERKFLDEHNYYREIHGCPPLTLNHSLSILAKEWARLLATKNTIQYRSDSKFGENIYMSSNETLEPNEIVKNWYDEIQYYKFNDDALSQNTAHFTQLIWKSTKELGIGIEQIDDTIWVVAFYSPPGNYLRQFNENVPAPSIQGIKTLSVNHN